LKGIPTMYPEVLIAESVATATSFTQPAPVYGFTSRLDGSCASGTDSANYHARLALTSTHCGGFVSNPENGGLCIPGMGAGGSSAAGGAAASACLGGRGRTGMVCISWECG
jgi:hypothetical protein